MAGCIVLILGWALGAAPAPVELSVDFSRHLRPWDGFGVNYVETAQTRDPRKQPQDYGGLSLLSEEQRQEVAELIFGSGGLQPGLVKMFLDPFQQLQPPPPDAECRRPLDLAAYNHDKTARWVRFFAREGWKRTKARGDALEVLVTLYGPPAWATRQGFVRGRDLAADRICDVARYMAAWIKFLREADQLPVKCLSLHNEGEDKRRWPADGSTDGRPADDYNLYWPPEQVVAFLKLLRPLLDGWDLQDVRLTPGETTNWYRFDEWDYAKSVADDPDALAALGLITSHGFIGAKGRWFGDYRNTGNALLRAKRPELHSWTTSMSWGKMDVDFVEDIRRQIYDVEVNAVIPWACIQSDAWVGGDPNPGTAIRVLGPERFEVRPGYYFYKQVSVAGQAGTAVAEVSPSRDGLGLLAFARADSSHLDACVLVNRNDQRSEVRIALHGTPSTSFRAYRTSATEHYVSLGELPVVDGAIPYAAPPRSVTTFFGVRP